MVHLFSDFKNLIEAIIGLDRNVLHVHLGLVLFFFLAWCFPGPGRYWKAFVWVAIIELVNEFFDATMAFDAAHRPNWPDMAADIINTLFWPAVWCLWKCRRRRRGQVLREAESNRQDLTPPQNDHDRNRLNSPDR